MHVYLFYANAPQNRIPLQDVHACNNNWGTKEPQNLISIEERTGLLQLILTNSFWNIILISEVNQ